MRNSSIKWPSNVLPLFDMTEWQFLEFLLISCGRVVRDFEGKQKIGVTLNSNKQDVIDFKKFSKLKMCRASEANS